MKTNRQQHLLFILLAGIPVYWAALFYIEMASGLELEELATAVTICFFGTVYAGRYLAQVWSAPNRTIPNYFLGLLLIIIAGCTIWLFIHPDYPLQDRPAFNLALYWLPFILMSLSLGIFFAFIRVSQQRLQEANTSAAHSQSELRLLQSQLSPHFLFNTLNNLYGLSITQHEKLPPLLLKLSELLRYSVYQAGELYVPLQEEVAYIRNYIDFEFIRLGDRLIMTVSIEEVPDAAIKIPPMLLIVFIENAFKHARNSTNENIYITLELKTWGKSILFTVTNSYQEQEGNSPDKKYSGFGLDNVQKRLQLLYQNQYNLKVEEQEGFYSVMLQLNTK